MKVLVPRAYRGELPVISDVEFVTINEREPVSEADTDAEVLVAWGQTPAILRDSAARLPKLRLVQAFLAGPDPVVAAGFAPDVPISSGVGLHDGPVSEHALGMILALLRNFLLAQRNQERHLWDPKLAGAMKLRADDGRVTTLKGAHVTIWGFGSIGSTLAPLIQALGGVVTGVARSAGERHGITVVSDDDLAEVLADTDVLVMILPNLPTTTKALNAQRLAELKPGAVLVNVGRGPTVDEAALEEALTSGRLAGAAIDVTATEPLPEDSALWDLPTLLITPHVAGGRPQDADVLLAHNIEAIRTGGELKNLVRR